MVVYKALLNEYAGVTHWWMPYLESKLRGDMPVREGAIFDVTINPTSRIASSKVSDKVTKIVEAKLIEEEVAGDFVGTASWTFEPTDGKTKVQYRFNARTNKLFFSCLSVREHWKKAFRHDAERIRSIKQLPEQEIA